MKPFLQAEWRKLAMANYAVDPSILKPYLPYKTEIDLWNNTCYVSLVGFMFFNTRVKGFRIPFHIDFEEVNLRFYVRYNDGAEWKRGVVFIKEIVSKPALSLVANALYKENYETMPMKHRIEGAGPSLLVEYSWKKGQWNSFRVQTSTRAEKLRPGSEEEFITEHYWGYTRIDKQRTAAYGVEHPVWDVYPVTDYHVDVDFGKVYGDDFAFLSEEKPASVLLAEGSPIVVTDGQSV